MYNLVFFNAKSHFYTPGVPEPNYGTSGLINIEKSYQKHLLR